MIGIIAALLFIIALPTLVQLIVELWPLIKLLLIVAGYALVLVFLLVLIYVMSRVASSGDLATTAACGAAGISLLLLIGFCMDRLR
jgi:hypothetical protein